MRTTSSPRRPLFFLDDGHHGGAGGRLCAVAARSSTWRRGGRRGASWEGRREARCSAGGEEAAREGFQCVPLCLGFLAFILVCTVLFMKCVCVLACDCALRGLLVSIHVPPSVFAEPIYHVVWYCSSYYCCYFLPCHALLYFSIFTMSCITIFLCYVLTTCHVFWS